MVPTFILGQEDIGIEAVTVMCQTARDSYWR